MRVPPFVHDALPQRIVFGPGSSRESLGAELDLLGAGRALALTTVRGAAAASGLLTGLGERVAATFTGVRQHVPVDVVDAATARTAEVSADCLLAVGGGSATGTAKAVALRTGLPVVAVPTTCAGSEMTPIWGVTDDQGKRTGRDVRVLPATVVYDPELTCSLPAAVTATSGLNALAHCVAALYREPVNPVAALDAEAGVRTLAGGLPAAVADGSDLAARSELMYGACLAGRALAAAGTGLHHAVCHALGGVCGLPHAETHAVLLPRVVAYLEPRQPDASARVAELLGARTAAEGLADLARQVGAPRSLATLGMRATDVDAVTAAVLAGSHPIERGELDDLLLTALAP